MDGFPPSKESQVTLMNMTTQPFSHWGFRNMTVQPSLAVARGGKIHEFGRRQNDHIEKISLEYNSKKYNVLDVLEADDTDGYLVVKDGTIVYERYWHDFTETDYHLWASSTKSLVGLCAGILVDQGKLDVNKKIPSYIPELKGSAFSDVTVRQALNMVSALDYSEDYVNLKPGSIHYEYFRRIGLTPAFDLMASVPTEADAPRGTLRLLPKFERNPDLEPSYRFEYHSPNVDVIGWIIQRQSGLSLNKFVEKHVWSKLQTEHDAAFTCDIDFTPIATGGFLCTLRDFARFGLCVLNDGRMDGEQVFPADWIRDTYRVTDEEIAHTTRSAYKDETASVSYDELIAYKNFWWVHDREKGIMMANGVFGQAVYVNRDKNVVIAMFSSAKSASNAARDTWKVKMHATQVIADSLN
jgi:CubicO group peptidase (beta-lactamase class C family)